MVRIGILLLCVLSLISCSTVMEFPNMRKDGATEQQRKTDSFECKSIAADFRNKYMGAAIHKKVIWEATEAANAYYIECMDLRGYKVVPEKETK